jgi:hypothetical protein
MPETRVNDDLPEEWDYYCVYFSAWELTAFMVFNALD